MKYKAHIPTEQYGFIEVEGDTLEDVASEYNLISRRVRNQQKGLEAKDWRDVLDRYLKEGKMDANKYAEMNSDQTLVIQEIKKSVKRQK